MLKNISLGKFPGSRFGIGQAGIVFELNRCWRQDMDE